MPNNPFGINAREHEKSSLARSALKQLTSNNLLHKYPRKSFHAVNTELGMRNSCWRQSPQ